MPRMAQLLEAVNAEVTDAVRSVFHVPAARLAHALLAQAASGQQPAPPSLVKPIPATSGTGTSVITEIQNWALQWQPVLMFVFFTAIIIVMWRTLKVMPRIKPQQIKPASSQAVSFADIAGVDEAKCELQEIVEFLRDPRTFHAMGRRVPRGFFCHDRPATARPRPAKALRNESGDQS